MKIKEKEQKTVLYSVLIFDNGQQRSYQRPDQLKQASEIATKLIANGKKEKTPNGEMIIFGEGEVELSLNEIVLLKEFLQTKNDWKLNDNDACQKLRKLFEF